MQIETAAPVLKTFVERAIVTWSHAGTIRGHEAHVVTGYVETRDVLDAPDGSGKMQVFVPTATVVRETSVEELENLLGASHAELVKDTASKGARAAERRERIVAMEQDVVAAGLRVRAAEAELGGMTERAQTAEAELLRVNGEFVALAAKSKEEIVAIGAEFLEARKELAALRNPQAKKTARKATT